MATLSDLTLKNRLWYHRYRFRRVDPLPWQPLRMPVSEARVGVITSAGIHVGEDSPFEMVKGGDFSFRILPAEVPMDALVVSHPSGAWDRAGVEADPNLAFPTDRLRELEASGEIGQVAPRNVSFQGSISAPMRLLKQSAPAVADIMADDGVDLVLLTPV